MSERQVTEKSKLLSWLLRHGAGQEGLTMDAAGWAPVDEVLRVARCSREVLEHVVVLNNKQRYEYDGDRVRASQGHSLDGMPVTLDGLERSWAVYDGVDGVWHGTSVEAIAGIARTGIDRGQRSHVHLAEAVDSHVGKRANVHVMLEVSVARLRAAGLEVYRSLNRVVLTRAVPVACILRLDPVSKRAKSVAADLRGLLGVER